MLNGLIEVAPKEGKRATKLIILLHGLGSDANDLAMIIPYMSNVLKNAHFVAINGTQKYDMGHFGFQWFTRKDDTVAADQIKFSADSVLQYCLHKLESLNLSFEDLFLIGFSQGAMLALYIATAFEKKLAGIISFAGIALPNPNFTGNIHTPLCFIHGTCDDILNINLMRNSAKSLIKLGFNVQTNEIENLTHSIDMESINIANNFITKLL